MNQGNRQSGAISRYVDAAIRDRRGMLYARVLSTPAPDRTDGSNFTYCCDIVLSGHQDQIVRNVPISTAARAVYYATANSAVTVEKHPETGRLEIIGYAKSMPAGESGRYTSIVDVAALTAAASVHDSTYSRPLTLAELSDPAFAPDGFGTIPLGAVGIFRGSTLLQVK